MVSPAYRHSITMCNINVIKRYTSYRCQGNPASFDEGNIMEATLKKRPKVKQNSFQVGWKQGGMILNYHLGNQRYKRLKVSPLGSVRVDCQDQNMHLLELHQGEERQAAEDKASRTLCWARRPSLCWAARPSLCCSPGWNEKAVEVSTGERESCAPVSVLRLPLFPLVLEWWYLAQWLQMPSGKWAHRREPYLPLKVYMLL